MMQKSRCTAAMTHLLGCQSPFMVAVRETLLKIDLSSDWDIKLRGQFLMLEDMNEYNDCLECNLEVYI